MERDAWKPRTPARGGKAGIPAREKAVPGILSRNSKGGCGCREFYPAKGGGCCHHFSGGAPACRGRNRGWGSRRGAGGGTGPLRPHPGRCPPLAPPPGRASCPPPALRGRPSRGEGTGRRDRGLRALPAAAPAGAERSGAGARLGPAQPSGAPGPSQTSRGAHTNTRPRIYRYLI